MQSNPRTRLQLQAGIEKWPTKAPFHITGYTFTAFEAVVVTLRDGDLVGRGEGLGVYYKRDTPTSMLAQVEALRTRIEAGMTRQELQLLLPAGGARNALDCALWDLEAKRSGEFVWERAGQEPPQALVTTFTVGADEPGIMADRAIAYTSARAIKLKLTDDEFNAQRVLAVRAARPDVWLMVDANQGFTRDSFARLLPTLVAARVDVVEQPFPIGNEAWLDGLDSPIRIAADESVQDRHDLPNVLGRADIINIKLDKCGGLTEALALASEARKLGFDLMVGNMSGSSLAMAPAFVVGQLCDVVDLDGPTFLTTDRSPAATYEDGKIWCPESLWGSPR
ncbi:dipeptide epimerase [Luteibacter rhizovicinus DSM 16549]|uniref:Dipeptide epimerase n=1 Tax=Luteibacter rhizovicinus DSM 16549 TaxID=1440763 RepID=A0A0G9HCK3_9GAMM|nr:dipeptide epimerase [Luteibacter rhizovicinus]APG05852.1 dipeptide epimerase [Luteibacter rhizovicinus DSM 16549]KLD67201.1 mandelate racemase [Luteibacter rhizovicinus DSM 16549]KLD76468.1 mandelate racemase [Xanthomonas hyacinthi DSM 19077]